MINNEYIETNRTKQMGWIIFILLTLFIFGAGFQVARTDKENFEQVKRQVELMNYLKGLNK